MWHHSEINKQGLATKIRQGEIRLGGNRVLKIFGKLDCKSGQRMKKVNGFSFYLNKKPVNMVIVLAGIACLKHIKTGSMELFEPEVNPHKNLLPHQGIVNYYGKLMPKTKADQYYNALMSSIEWRNDEAVIFGKLITTKRKVAWYGDREFEYTYSNVTKHALPWTKELLELKILAEQTTGEQFNSCLLNLYHTGEEGMAWHSDGEKDLKKDGAIGSMSFGAERKFSFRHKQTKEVVSVKLEHGSLLVMKGTTQTHWLHRLPPTKLITTPRINLTFRTIVG